jgi:hypothetical protein
MSKNNMRVEVTCTRNLGACYKRAMQECPYGFQLIDNARHYDSLAYSNNGYTVTPVFKCEIIIECKRFKRFNNPIE